MLAEAEAADRGPRCPPVADADAAAPARPAGAPATLSLADRFATLLAVGRRIASAPSPAAVYAAVREAAVIAAAGRARATSSSSTTDVGG